MGRISALTELTSLAPNDYIIALDSSANIAKKITVANAFGIPEAGWTASGETWVYASWTASTRTGTITVPTDATTKYQAGMRIKISQSTGGTKYGIITKVASTLLTVFFPSGTTLNNETISTPYYSSLKVPYGFNADPALWSLVYTTTSTQLRSSPANGTWYASGSSLVVPSGAWRIRYSAALGSTRGSAGAIRSKMTLATSSASETDAEMTSYTGGTSATVWIGNQSVQKDYLLTADTTYYLNYQAVSGSPDDVQLLGASQPTIITALCGYL